MKVTPGSLSGVLIIDPAVFRDERGFFLETYNEEKYRAIGISLPFVQDNHSKSSQRTLRGLHAQRMHPQGKLVRVVRGAVLDVMVDIRRDSPTYKKWMSVELTEDNFRQCYVPPGFAHGFYTLSPIAEMEYKCTDFYYPEDELQLQWNDPELGIEWGAKEPILSKKDQAGRPLRELEHLLPTNGGTM
jgi:dTDP-4-dehydrorhamnose 3,5-epimerase